MTEGYSDNGVYWRRNDFKSGRITLVFVHGLSGSSSAWIPYESKFGEDYNLLSFDFRGHGKSVKKKDFDYYSLEFIADDIFNLARRFGLNDFILVGHSFGALLALDFARKHQKMLSRLILLAPDYRISQTLRAKLARPFLELAKIISPMPFEERIVIHIDYKKFFGTGDWDAKRICADIRNTSLRVYCHCLRQASKIDGEKMVANLRLPTLIVHGKKDTVFPCSDSEKLAKKIPNVDLRILPDANHILVINNFKEVAGEIEKFIGRRNC